MKLVKGLLRYLFSLLLKIPFLRRKAAFDFRHAYFQDLELSIPLDHGLSCPIEDLDGLYSFSEMFVSREYDAVWDHIGLPNKWLDIGCHRGYFSLYLAWLHSCKHDTQPFEALLIDADPRVTRWVESMRYYNRTPLDFKVMNRAVANVGTDSIRFALRYGMVSSIYKQMGPVQKWVKVPRLKIEDILAQLKPPYDLVKIDIEGAEFLFIEQCGDLLAQSKAVLIEWHEENEYKEPPRRLVEMFKQIGFTRKITVQWPAACQIEDGMRLWTGTELFLKQ